LGSDFTRPNGESRSSARDDKNAPASVVLVAMCPALAAILVAGVEASSAASYRASSEGRPVGRTGVESCGHWRPSERDELRTLRFEVEDG